MGVPHRFRDRCHRALGQPRWAVRAARRGYISRPDWAILMPRFTLNRQRVTIAGPRPGRRWPEVCSHLTIKRKGAGDIAGQYRFLKVSCLRFACAAILAIALVPAFSLLLPGRTIPADLRASAASIRGGINAEPAMRLWRYMGRNPDSWWCVLPNCCQTPSPATTINTELNLM